MRALQRALQPLAASFEALALAVSRLIAPSGDLVAVLARSLVMTPFGVFVASPKPSLREQNLQQAVSALRQASELVQALDRDLQARIGELHQLQDQYEHYSHLVTIEEEKASALLDQVQTTVDRGRKREWVIAAIINLVTGAILFALGIVVQRYWLS